MADHAEIVSFVNKYFGLLRSGLDAELSLKFKAGKAYLQLNLGLLPPNLHNAKHKPRNGPSRIRRRERRAKKRAELAAAQVPSTDRENDENSAVTRSYCSQPYLCC